MKRIIAGLAALTAAAGISCARDAPVYSSQELVTQDETTITYKETKWDSTQLTLTIRTVENGQVISERSWTRTENADSHQCRSIDLLDVRPVTMEMPDGETLEGIWSTYFRDEGCDRTFEHGPEIYVSSNDPRTIMAETQAFRSREYGLYMQDITDIFGDLDAIIERWHKDKRL